MASDLTDYRQALDNLVIVAEQALAEVSDESSGEAAWAAGMLYGLKLARKHLDLPLSAAKLHGPLNEEA